MGRAIVREPQAFLMDEPLSQPRRQAARLDARAALAPARAARRDHRLRHPRPGRGDDARPARRGPARRRAAAVRHARDAVRPPREPVRGRVHRLARDEPRRGGARTARRASAPAACRSAGSPLRGRIVLGIRPHDLKLGGPGIPGRVQVVERLGTETHVVAGIDAPRLRSARAGRRASTPPPRTTTSCSPRTTAPSFTVVTDARARSRSATRRADGRPDRCTASTSRPARRSVASRRPPTRTVRQVNRRS